MAEIQHLIREFNDIVDPQAKPYGTDVGERGIVSQIMHNPIANIFYYLHFRRVWFHKFGMIFRKTIPKEHTRIEGVSIPVRQLERAIGNNNSMIVICKENVDYSRSWLGYEAKDWHKYFTQYETLHIKNKSQIDEIPEACIPITLLRSMRGFIQ